MKKLPTLTIGIPAYNEENNIMPLLRSLLEQRQKSFFLKNILVVSDGSSDNTVSLVRNFSDPRVACIKGTKRVGKPTRENQIIARVSTDILVIIDADVLPKDDYFLENLVTPLLNKSKIGVVGARTESLPGKTLVERVIATSHAFKQRIYERVSNGNTVYLCHGRARAFSRAFYQVFRFPESGPEDALSYFACLAAGFRFKFAKDACVYFRSPVKIAGHIHQSIRFLVGISNLSRTFGDDTIKQAYRLPTFLVLSELGKAFLNAPAKMFLYCLITIYVRFLLRRDNISLSTWKVSTSTKRLITQ